MATRLLIISEEVAFFRSKPVSMFRPDCEDCVAIRMNIARLRMEENTIMRALSRATAARDMQLSQRIAEQLDRLRADRATAQNDFRAHRKVHTGAGRRAAR
jgi:hypothetical protein